MRYTNKGNLTPKNLTQSNGVSLFHYINIIYNTLTLCFRQRKPLSLYFFSFTYDKTPYNLFFNDFLLNTEHKPDNNHISGLFLQ